MATKEDVKKAFKKGERKALSFMTKFNSEPFRAMRAWSTMIISFVFIIYCISALLTGYGILNPEPNFTRYAQTVVLENFSWMVLLLMAWFGVDSNIAQSLVNTLRKK